MVTDKKAEDLEQRGMWRRASARWQEVLLLCRDKKQEAYIQQRLAYCLQQLKSRKTSESTQCSFQALSRAASDTEKTMGIYRSTQDIHNNLLRNKSKKKTQQRQSQ
ncbi:PerC family transcriptional regulator [Escherichia coli]|uniref:PerC family transcriptional regulator n=1 Tax=Escherichia coli TaxID=562 RepID=UPI000BE4132A|nr:PerC family transcriptional regulator [Escherichia coli]MBB7556644.1 PerC family transcriptional regulator [Escherichia coli]